MDTQTTAIAAQAAPQVFAQTTVFLLMVLMVRDMIWKGIALWKAGKNNHIVRFIIMFILNTL